MKLIDPDAIVNDLEEWKKNPNNDTEAVVFVNHFIGIIETQPTIEAEPVRRGKWIAFHQSGDLGYKCSLCNRHAYGVDVEMFGGDYNYCPNCGARMEGEEG